ncbi:DUF4304 domain-containing protein [Streptomyces radiopugnans]|uniref:DUF4304 domain-containing protein n=1 Tax=Streptomyces radiopugnans TaxID=403935 RepID=UPI003F1ADC47
MRTVRSTRPPFRPSAIVGAKRTKDQVRRCFVTPGVGWCKPRRRPGGNPLQAPTPRPPKRPYGARKGPSPATPGSFFRRVSSGATGRTLPDAAVVGVQESRWDESCYVNVGFAPAVNVKAGWLPESKCLVRFRVDAITSISREDFDLLSGRAAETSGEDDLRVGLVEKIATPVARAVNPIESIQGLKSLLRASVSDQVFIHREIRGELLEEE